MAGTVGYFEVYAAWRLLGRQKWFWKLRGGNGEPIATSEPYSSHANAVRGAEDARRVAASAVDIRIVDGKT